MKSLIEASWNRIVEDSIDRLRFCDTQEIVLDGERFCLSVPSEAILYEMIRQAAEQHIDLGQDEIDAGHIAYDFEEDIRPGYVPYWQRKIRNYRIKYVTRPREEGWLPKDVALEEHPDKLGEVGHSKIMDNGEVFFGLADKNFDKRFPFRPMLVPLNQNGRLDTTFSQSVPDFEVTEGGCLVIRYEYKEKKHVIRYGDYAPGRGGALPRPSPPPGSIIKSIGVENVDFRNEILSKHPIRWRSFRNVLVCTRSFSPVMLSMAELYELGLVPKALPVD